MMPPAVRVSALCPELRTSKDGLLYQYVNTFAALIRENLLFCFQIDVNFD